MGKGWGDPSGSGVAVQGRAGKAPTGPLMRFTEARNDKPPIKGVDANRGLVLLSECLSRCREDSHGGT
jgi:hypothetical protein